MNLLHTLGLMTRKEHEAAAEEANADFALQRHLSDRWEAKFKRAATDLAAQAEKLARLESLNTILLETNASLRPDAEAMRRKRQMDRDRAAGKRGKA